jgi:phage terminase small subunit
VLITDTADLPEDKAAALASIKQTANGIDVKLHDKVRALELLGKAVGMFDNREAPSDADNNLFDSIVESAGEELSTDDIPEIEQAAAAGDDVVEPPTV